ncbi:MAG: PilZ domain-containing protein [Planctomycetes bacterium]|nr:PilZ domain-containing protein [Planctomycetota bacterium]
MLFFKKRRKTRDRREMRRLPVRNRIAASFVVLSDGRRVEVEVMDSSGTGARVLWSAARGEQPEAGSILRLALRLAGADPEHAIEARVVRVVQGEDALEIGLHFVAPERDLAEVEAIDRPFFDRRRHPRHRPPQEVAVDFRHGAITLCGRLIDLSRGGLALGLAPDLAGTLAPGDQGSLILVLPEGGGRIELEAELRHRDRAGTRLGFRFEAPEDDPRLERIARYLDALPPLDD